jgi:hypothetical protein
VSWFKWHIGTVNDPRFKVVSLRSRVTFCDVIAVWIGMLEYAAQSKPQGFLAGWDHDEFAARLGMQGEAVQAVFHAMQGRFLDGIEVVAWRRSHRAPSDDPQPWHDRLGLSNQQWAALRTRVFERDDYTCGYCGTRGGRLECDHIIPLSIGGSTAMANLRAACRPCNRKKRNKTPSEWSRVNG